MYPEFYLKYKCNCFAHLMFSIFFSGTYRYVSIVTPITWICQHLVTCSTLQIRYQIANKLVLSLLRTCWTLRTDSRHICVTFSDINCFFVQVNTELFSLLKNPLSAYMRGTRTWEGIIDFRFWHVKSWTQW